MTDEAIERRAAVAKCTQLPLTYRTAMPHYDCTTLKVASHVYEHLGKFGKNLCDNTG